VTPARPARRAAPLLGAALVTLTACAALQDARPDAPAGAPAAAPRAADAAMRPCARADLLGTWQVVRMGAARSVTVDRSAPEYYPHQRYVFAADATMRYLAAQKAITAEDHRTLAAAPATATTWAVDETGRLLTQADGVPRQEVSTCAVLLKQIEAGEAGDVVLTRLDAEGRALSRRQLRRLERAPE